MEWTTKSVESTSNPQPSSSPVVAVTVIYSVFELLLATHITIANLLVLSAYARNRRLRTATNTYICSLATADALAGLLAIPATVFSALTGQPHSFNACAAAHLPIVTLSAVSSIHLVAIAADKYLSICGGLASHRGSRFRRAVTLIAVSWLGGLFFGALPVIAYRQPLESQYDGECRFLSVIDVSYLVNISFYLVIVLPTFLITFCYVGIYRRIRREAKAVRELLNGHQLIKRHLQRRNIIKSLVLVVFTFFFCWYPLFVINSVSYYCPDRCHIAVEFVLFAVILSHFSAALNPLIYAYSLPGFRLALTATNDGDGCCCCPQIGSRSTTFGLSGDIQNTPTTRFSQRQPVPPLALQNGVLGGRRRPRTIDSGAELAFTVAALTDASVGAAAGPLRRQPTISQSDSSLFATARSESNASSVVGLQSTTSTAGHAALRTVILTRSVAELDVQEKARSAVARLQVETLDGEDVSC